MAYKEPKFTKDMAKAMAKALADTNTGNYKSTKKGSAKDKATTSKKSK